MITAKKISRKKYFKNRMIFIIFITNEIRQQKSLNL